MPRFAIKIFAAFTVLTLSITASADSAEGKWSIVSRTCSNGKPASDAFVLGRDSMIITINDPYFAKVETTIDGKTKFFHALIDLERQELHFLDALDMVSKYTIISSDNSPKHPELKVVSGGFGPGGSCPQGELLTAVFNKQ